MSAVARSLPLLLQSQLLSTRALLLSALLLPTLIIFPTGQCSPTNCYRALLCRYCQARSPPTSTDKRTKHPNAIVEGAVDVQIDADFAKFAVLEDTGTALETISCVAVTSAPAPYVTVSAVNAATAKYPQVSPLQPSPLMMESRTL